MKKDLVCVINNSFHLVWSSGMKQPISHLICSAARAEVGGQRGRNEEKKRCKQEQRRGRTEEKEIDSGTGAVGVGGRASVTMEMEMEGGDK